jgi:hypothetical protein
MFRRKFNEEIHMKLILGDRKDALCQRAVDTLAARFPSGITSVEDDDMRGRPSRDDFPTVVSGHLKRNSHASCREIAKDLFVPKNIISLVLKEIGSRFFIARWVVPQELWAESKANRVNICQKMPEVLEKLGP